MKGMSENIVPPIFLILYGMELTLAVAVLGPNLLLLKEIDPLIHLVVLQRTYSSDLNQARQGRLS